MAWSKSAINLDGANEIFVNIASFAYSDEEGIYHASVGELIFRRKTLKDYCKAVVEHLVDKQHNP